MHHAECKTRGKGRSKARGWKARGRRFICTGRETKFEKELDEDSDSESEVEEEEPHFGYYDDGGANSDSSDVSLFVERERQS